VEVKEIILEGHVIDSWVLPKVLDLIMDLEGDFEFVEFKVGKRKTEKSFVRMLIKGRDQGHLDELLNELRELGAALPEMEELEVEPAPADAVLPPAFYSSTNHPTFVSLKGNWVGVSDIEMDCAIVIGEDGARCVPISGVAKGDRIVVGNRGVRVIPPERPREATGIFEFMTSVASSEKPVGAVVSSLAREMWELRERGAKVLVVAGPAVVHTGAGPSLAWLISKGFVGCLLAGNALAVHDVESALFGTSLGTGISSAHQHEGGHRHHLLAINEVRGGGGLRRCVEEKVIKKGIMYELIRNDVPFVLAGSIRDDGPLPEVVTDVMEAQQLMREALRGAELVVMFSTMLHSIAVGNLLPSSVRTVCVDISSSAVTKLLDRGSAQVLGIVSDVGIFLPSLMEELRALEGSG
jgi:lysine-ketoglutarate reductase/saccharopine dehydrogenase-like protein (TIGR00300 family)